MNVVMAQLNGIALGMKRRAARSVFQEQDHGYGDREINGSTG